MPVSLAVVPFLATIAIVIIVVAIRLLLPLIVMFITGYKGRRKNK